MSMLSLKAITPANKHSMLVTLNTTYLKQPSTFFFLECYTYMLRKFKDFLGPLEAGREGPSLKMLTLYRRVLQDSETVRVLLF